MSFVPKVYTDILKQLVICSMTGHGSTDYWTYILLYVICIVGNWVPNTSNCISGITIGDVIQLLKN